MKKAVDRQSIIEGALSGFEWHARLGVWLALSFANLCFLFWANLGLNSRVHGTFLAMAMFCIPWRRVKTWAFATRGVLAILALFVHLIFVKEMSGKLPVILLVIPAYLSTEFFRGWSAKFSVVGAFWLLHVYWSAQGYWSQLTLSGSVVGFVSSCVVLALFEGLQRDGRRRAREQLRSLQGKNDFDVQRVHASRLQVIGELSATLIHEIANPLTNIGGFFAQLSDFEELRLSTRWKELSSKIQGNLERMRSLLHAYRSFSRHNSHEQKEFSIHEIFQDAELLTKQIFQTKKVEFTMHEVSFDFNLRGNRVEIGQIVVNFLLNALSAVQNGAVKSVKLGAEMHGENFLFYVEDSGHGVEDNVKEAIFRPFFTTKGADGSGLGLYISKIIADNHACIIHVDRSTKGGARFELIFPKEKIVHAPEKKVA